MPDLYSPKKSETVTNGNLSVFWPFVLLALSVCAILTWQLIVGNQVHQHASQLIEQQNKLVEQSRRVQGGLQKFARDLVEVAKTDEDAKAIVTKYGISVANPAPAATPQPSP